MRDGSPWQRIRRIFRHDPDREVGDELDFHLEQRIRDYIARGMEPDAARNAALERLGDLEGVRTECAGIAAGERRRESRRIRLNVSWLDVKLGLRMLVKYPGLSLVSGFGMAIAIAIAAGAFSAVHSIVGGTLPLDEGDRVVVVENHRADRPGSPDRQVLHDFVVWREQLRSVRDLGAVRYDRRNLVTAGGSTELVDIAEMTAMAFRVARVAPMLGRPLLEGDEQAAAPPVMVIAHEEWQRRFDGDPQIIGRPVRLGTTVHTVVGVMPEGFRFPAFHRYWIPLRLNPLEYAAGGGPAIEVIGRLADGFTLSEAQAELTALGQRVAATSPETHEHVRPRIVPFVEAWVGIDSPTRAAALLAFQVVMSLLLAVVSVNVAILVYARTASRVGEIAVRNALGASRARVVTQLFVEALVLSAAAAALGLVIANVSLGILVDLLADGLELPYWIDFGLSAEVILYAAGLAILGGAIVGVVPALGATGKRVQGGLQQLASRSSQMQLGRLWTGLIVAQVAVAVALLPAVIPIATTAVRNASGEPGYPADRFLRARLSMEPDEASQAGEAAANDALVAARFRDRVEAVVRRLEAEPGVAGVTFATSFPGDELDGRMEVEVAAGARETAPGPDGGAASVTIGARMNRIDVDLFPLFGVPIVAGRGFVEADRSRGSTAVIVNRRVAERIATTGPVLGRRVRLAPRTSGADGAGVSAPWLEIVGIVPEFPNPSGLEDDEPKFYQPLSYDERFDRIDLAVRVSAGPAETFATRLRDVTASVDPTLRLDELQTAASFWRDEQRLVLWFSLGIAIIAGSVLLLSAAGIYAMLSFTVARRRREIGIRTALGADSRQILRGIFARASAQLGTGVAFGLLLALAADQASGGWIMSSVWARPASGAWYGHPAFIIAPAVALLMMGVGLVAAIGPARRGLAVEPTEVLREE
jgi:predicted permease